MRAAIIQFPGTNREHDMAMALRVAGAIPDFVWHKDNDIGGVDLIVLPGGFSYGDYLRCGAMAAHSPVMRDVIAKAEKGVPVLGVCNGFQMLLETGLLPGALMRNQSLRFICKRVRLRCENDNTIFSRKIGAGSTIEVPVAHGEGNYFTDEQTVSRLKDEGRVAFRYEEDVNGSVDRIAGIYSENKTILGMMPHPENATQPWQANQDGRPLFQSLVESLMS